MLAVWGPDPSLAPEDDVIPIQCVHLLHAKADIIALWRPLPVNFCSDSFAMLGEHFETDVHQALHQFLQLHP